MTVDVDRRLIQRVSVTSADEVCNQICIHAANSQCALAITRPHIEYTPVLPVVSN